MPRSASGPASATAGRPLGGHGGSGKRWAMKASCRGVRTSLTRTGDMGGLLGMGKLRLFSVRWIYATGSPLTRHRLATSATQWFGTAPRGVNDIQIGNTPLDPQSTLQPVSITPKLGTTVPDFSLTHTRSRFQIRIVFTGYRSHFFLYPCSFGSSGNGA